MNQCSYVYNIENTENGASRLSTSFTGANHLDLSPDKVKAQAIQMIRSLVSISNTFNPLPSNRILTMKMFFNGSVLLLIVVHNWLFCVKINALKDGTRNVFIRHLLNMSIVFQIPHINLTWFVMNLMSQCKDWLQLQAGESRHTISQSFDGSWSYRRHT